MARVEYYTVSTYLRLRLPGALMLTAGALAATESAASAIGAGPAHHLPIFGDVYSPLDGIRWLSALNGHCVIQPWQQHTLLHRAVTHRCATHPSVILAINAKAAALFAAGFVPFAGLRLVEVAVNAQTKKGRSFAALRSVEGAPPPLVIEIGRATGELNKLGHAAGIRKGQRVRLVGPDVSQDTLALGGKGAGKTLWINSVLLQTLQQDCGALVFNVKGDYDGTALELARRAGRKVRVIGFGEGAEKINLNNGISPEMGAAYMSALLLLAGGQDKGAMFWNQTGANLTRGVLGLLQCFPYRYSFPGLYRYLFVKAERAEVDARIAELLTKWREAAKSATGERRAAIVEQITYIEGCILEVANFHEQTHDIQSGTRTHLSMILSKTVVPEVENAFFLPDEGDGKPFRFESLYEDGDVFVINCPLQEYGLSAAAIMAFAKLQFYAAMEKRRIRKDVNRTRRVGLFIDECQEITTCSREGMSDHTALAKSRDTGMFSVWATQSMSALTAKLGDEMAAALVANLRNRIVFRSENKRTIEDVLYLLGQIEFDRKSTSETRQPGSWFKSKGETHAPQLQAVANPALFRSLRASHALALLSIDNESADDVLKMAQVFV